MGKRQIAAQETRKKIVVAAKRLTEEKGFENITVDDIVKEAGIAKGSFYTYFPHKEDVAAEITRDNFKPMAEKSMTLEGNVYEKLGTFITESMQFIMDAELYMAQEWMKKAVDPAFDFTTDKLRYDMGIIRDIIEKGIEEGELDSKTPVNDWQEIIIAQYYGALSVWCISNGEINPVELLKRYTNTQLKTTLKNYMK